MGQLGAALFGRERAGLAAYLLADKAIAVVCALGDVEQRRGVARLCQFPAQASAPFACVCTCAVL